MSVSQRLTYVANSEPDYFMGFPSKVNSEPTNLSQRASTALTIMVKSIKSGFKQAIGYFFNPSSLNTDRLRTIVEKGLKLITEAHSEVVSMRPKFNEQTSFQTVWSNIRAPMVYFSEEENFLCLRCTSSGKVG